MDCQFPNGSIYKLYKDTAFKDTVHLFAIISMINTRSLSTGLFVQLVAAKQPIDKIIAFLAFAVEKTNSTIDVNQCGFRDG